MLWVRFRDCGRLKSTHFNLVAIGGREVKDPELVHRDRSVRLVKNCFQCQSEPFKIRNNCTALQMFYAATDWNLRLCTMTEAEGLHTPTLVANCVLNGFLSYTAIVLNIITIHALRKTSSLPTTLKTLLLSLSISDLGVGLLVAFLTMEI